MIISCNTGGWRKCLYTLKKLRHNRRKHSRYHTNCQCWVEQDAVTLFGKVTNISHDGLFLRTLPLVETGSLIDIKLNMDDCEVTATGKVCWANAEPTPGKESLDSPPGLGIQFVEFKGGRDIIEEFIKKPSLIPQVPPESE